MNRILALLLAFLVLGTCAFGQGRSDRRASDTSTPLRKPAVKADWGQSVITINKLGQTVTNLGQFYAYSGTLPAGEWPLGSGHDQIFRMNMYVGMPGNVVATRARNSKEWDPIPGLHAPAAGKIALSNDRTTWPLNASNQPFWPLRTAAGLDSIVSQQDSYCEYWDLTNARPTQRLSIRVRQTTYAWNTSKDQDYIIMKFTLFNDTTTAKNGVYFAMYTDFDAGGTVNDYEDDLWSFDAARQLYYIGDADNYSNDWGAGGLPFNLGIEFLETPLVGGVRPGITDWHYSSDNDSPWGDVLKEDTVLYNWMSSNPILKNDPTWPNLFHGSNLKMDDVSLINPAGQRLDAIGASGPYHMEPHDSLTFVIALIAGANPTDITIHADRARDIYRNGLRLVPPPKPVVNATAFDNHVNLTWSNAQEFTYVNLTTGAKLIKEYRVYRTGDPSRKAWGTPVAIIPRDTTRTTVDTAAYVWPDSVRNFSYMSYSVTVLDVDSLESGKAFLPSDQRAAENTVEVRPVNSPREGLDAIRVVPNPYVISASWERKRLGDPLLGEPIRDLAFTHLPGRCTIRIYTLDGNLVKTIEHTSGTGTEFWDLRSYSNQLIATGVYFYHVSSNAGERVSKFAVVR